jgi:nitroimidazol reductase NimA-like FMN-containing flavoprotein (pyridoxamine 5'-phosphate oxidase superfamily)
MRTTVQSLTKEPPMDKSTLDELSREDCLRRLASFSVGRLAVAIPGEPPLVMPMNYVLDDEVVVFRTDLGHKLLVLREFTEASFQIDEIDPYHRSGWSVLVQGHAYEAAPSEVRHLRVDPWAGGSRDRWIRLVPARITGRTIRLPEPYRDGRAYL